MTKLTDRQKALLDEFFEESGDDTKTLLDKGGLMDGMRKYLIEAVLEGELTDHLGYKAHDPAGNNSGNSRNGRGSKTVQGKNGPLRVDVPRDRNGSFEPKVIRKGQRRIDRLDDTILALYARGNSTREIAAELREIYDGVEVSASLISEVTDSVMGKSKEWQSRPLDRVYPIIYFDCLRVKTREDGSVRNKAVYLALGINMAGEKDLLGLWISDNEGAGFWTGVLSELKSRGVEDCFVACVDGLTGFPEAIESVFPATRVQLCIVHQVRNSMKYVSWKDRKAVAADLRAIYTAPSAEAAGDALERFGEKWDRKYPAITPGWKRNWERLIPFFDYSLDIRRVIYTTNVIESMNYSMRRVVKGRGAFPNDDAVRKVLYLALQNASKKWTRPIHNWKSALNQFIILYGDRVEV